MVVNPAVPTKSVAEFIAYAKANPGKINMASSGIGGSNHVAGELFKLMTGTDIVHVPVSRRWAGDDRPPRWASADDVCIRAA
jgi:tripartite-type tricarboxylate transporter receptor subunit TctC